MASLILSITALLVSVTTLLVMLYISRNEGRWSFFTEYTDRYSSIMKEISEAVLRDVEVQELDVAPIRRYFDLCSEEYYLHITPHAAAQGMAILVHWHPWHNEGPQLPPRMGRRSYPQHIQRRLQTFHGRRLQYNGTETLKKKNEILSKALHSSEKLNESRNYIKSV